MAHGAVVAMTPVITSRKSKGPLDHVCHRQREVNGVLSLGLSGSGCTDGPQLRNSASVGHKTAVQLVQRPGVDDEVCSKPEGKAAHEIYERQGLKPDTGNRSVRDFRGLGGNGCVAVFQPAGGMPRVCMKYGSIAQTAPPFYWYVVCEEKEVRPSLSSGNPVKGECGS
jgi:hypothetical protein